MLSEADSEKMLARIDSLAQIPTEDILSNLSNLEDPEDSFIAAKALCRLNAVFGRLFFDISPGVFGQFLDMQNKELRTALSLDTNEKS